MPETRDPYRILQLHPSAVPEMVEAAYRTLALLHHPDRTDDPAAAALMADLNWAYATLRDAGQRAEYDQTRMPIPVDVTDERSEPAIGTSLSQRFARAAAAAAERDVGDAAGVTLDFGRYAGMTLRQIARIEPAYLEWLKRHSSGIRYRHQIEHVLASLTPAPRASSTE